MPPGLYNPFQVLKPLRVLNPFGALQPGYTDISKPLPGETPFEYEHRKAVVANAGALEGEVNAIGRNVGRAGSYLFGDAATQQQQQATAAATVKPKVKPQSVFDNSITGLTDQLINRGIPGHVARGVAAGLLAESNGDPNAFNSAGGGQGAYGLSQWRGPRQAALRARYGDKPTPEQQLDFLVHELKGGDQGGASVLAARTPQEALTSFVDNFLRPGEGRFGDLKRGYQAMGMAINESMLGDADTPGTLMNPFSPRFAQAQLGELEKARTALKTPTRTDFDAGPMPTMAEAPPVPKTDFSGADRALQALKPVEFTMKEAENLRWANFWGGLGQAMMRSPEGEGLGSFFLRLGGAGLASVGQTRSDIQARKDEFDNKLAKWNAALYEHDFNKAQIMQREATMDWQAGQNRAMEEYRAGMELWGKTAIPQVVGTDLVFTHLGKDGKGSIIRQPIGPLVDAAVAQSRAGVYGQAFGVDNAASASIARVVNGVQASVATAHAGQALADANTTPQEKAAAAAYVPVMALNYAADTGQISTVIGEDEAEMLTEEVVKTLTSQGIYPGDKGYEDAFKKYAIGRMTSFVMQSPEAMDRLMKTMAPAAELYQGYERYQQRTEQYTTNSRGQSTQRTTYEGPDE